MGGAEGEDEGLFIEPPRCYLMHFFDDDIFGVAGSSVASLARFLDPCRVVALGVDEEAARCNSLEELASLFRQRVLSDVHENPCASLPGASDFFARGGGEADAPTYVERVVLIGYGFGAVVAHQVAVQLRAEGPSLEVALVLLDSEVSWPPSYSIDRMGGYQWLGGKLEAALLMCRSVGHMDFARDAVREVLASRDDGECDEEDLLMRAFWTLAPGGMTHKYYNSCIEYLELALDVMHDMIAASQAPSEVFAGDALLISSTSREFRVAQGVNSKYCSDLEVAHCRGTHYSMVQDEHIHSVIKPLSDFLLTRGYLGLVAQKSAHARGRLRKPPRIEGLDVVNEGDQVDAPTVYIVHEVKPYITQAWKDRVSELLAPCRVIAVEFDSRAALCEMPEDLVVEYEYRILGDVRRHAGRP
eukprot:CAMPEP_0177481830 /NCGR_PEP_ID=MMETSP0369-20130122/26596_1 /TAXON_ID=447022 ORGANISM="Scrippsiella hangoei-like, Strain SHHI-4" /NCGR_SAMPLE_ID=MMETSP0369 /ASSEMBLY_ACC=CAM_ASM_000364 /LENGTH=414 /DNA_ID=CAMNT_0018957687 /DNA_START=48 /DNA_END=1288 /DNA_ORIENTATION=-